MSFAAAEVIRRWRESPLAMVRELFKVEPDAWQRDVLEAFPHRQRVAMVACKGPGKTAVLAWLAWNFLLTRPHPKIAATSISGDNLADNLWTEMAKWRQKCELLQATFEWTSSRIFAKEHPETWWMSARTWSQKANKEQQSDTLAGIHADYCMALLDESGGIPDAVMATAEGVLTAGKEGHIVQAGNPTRLEGPLYRAATTERSMWHVTEITADPADPKRTPRVPIQWALDQIEIYGRDHPWVIVNVFGRFPPSSMQTLLSPDEVRDAMKRHLREDQYSFAAKILGVDVARFGDDQSVIFPRQGLAAFKPTTMRNADSVQGAGAVANAFTHWDADSIQIDSTGGWGTGWVDGLRTMNYGRFVLEVEFAGEPSDRKFLNKRAEMWWKMAEWVKGGGALPEIPELVGELSVPTYHYKGDRIAIEEKAQIKSRLGRSPDYADGLGCTFAFPVSPRVSALRNPIAARSNVVRDYDPYARD